MNERKIGIGIFVIIIIAGCDLSEALTPSFLKINEVSVTNLFEEGMLPNQITEIYVYVNETFTGAYPLPAEIPLLMEGQSQVTVYPGIKENGILSTPSIYPYYQPFEVMTTLTLGSIHSIEPLFSYKDEVAFKLIDNFNGNTHFVVDLDGDEETQVILSEENNIQFGKITLSPDHNFVKITHDFDVLDLPFDGSSIFVELNYKNNTPIEIGLIGQIPDGNSFEQSKIVLYEKDEWNKIYINLSPDIQASQLPIYRLYLQAVHNEALDESEIYLDNIKWIHL